MVEFRNVANFDAVWLPRWRRAKVRAYRAKKSKKKVCSGYLFENMPHGLSRFSGRLRSTSYMVYKSRDVTYVTFLYLHVFCVRLVIAR